MTAAAATAATTAAAAVKQQQQLSSGMRAAAAILPPLPPKKTRQNGEKQEKMCFRPPRQGLFGRHTTIDNNLKTKEIPSETIRRKKKENKCDSISRQILNASKCLLR